MADPESGKMEREQSQSRIDASSRPFLPRHIKLRQDKARGVWTVLAPERVFTPDPVAVAILQRCDGARSVDTIADELARIYDAPAGQILADVIELLQGLAEKGVVKT
jgi:pyrroloquinoline quinone biosynthesis protein D